MSSEKKPHLDKDVVNRKLESGLLLFL